MQKVLITGASGFVGFHLVEKCVESGLHVHVAVRSSSVVSHLRHLPLTFVYPDFSNAGSLASELEKHRFSYVIHAAGTTKARNAQEYEHINATYTANLAAAIDQVGGVKKMVFISSLGAIGPLLNYNQLITDDQLPSPVTAYGRSKLLAEKLLEGCQVPLVILRPTAVYGPREKDIFIVFKSISRGYEPYIGSVDQQLSFIYVKDLANLTVKALLGTATGAFNVTDGKCYSRYQMGIITRQLLNRKTIKIHVPMRVVKGLAVLLETGYGWMNKASVLNREKLNELTAINWCCDISRLKSELQFEPQFDLEAGLQQTLEWYKTNKWL